MSNEPHFTLGPWSSLICHERNGPRIEITGYRGNYEALLCNVVDDKDVLGKDGELQANAHLIVAAPEMYDALLKAREAIDTLFARLIYSEKDFMPTQCGQPWQAILETNRVLDKAMGKSLKNL